MPEVSCGFDEFALYAAIVVAAVGRYVWTEIGHCHLISHMTSDSIVTQKMWCTIRPQKNGKVEPNMIALNKYLFGFANFVCEWADFGIGHMHGSIDPAANKLWTESHRKTTINSWLIIHAKNHEPENSRQIRQLKCPKWKTEKVYFLNNACIQTWLLV